MSLGGICERRNVPSLWEHHVLTRRSARIDREPHILRGEYSSWLAAGRTERDKDRPHCTSQPETGVYCCVKWLGAETQTSTDRPRKRIQFGGGKTAKRA